MRGTGVRQMRRYRAKRWKRFFFCITGVLCLCIAGYLYLSGTARALFSPAPVPTLSPEEAVREERKLSLPQGTWYVLQLGALENESAALSLAGTFVSRGAAGYIHGDEKLFRVLAAAYPTRAEAQQVQSRLLTEYQVETFALELVFPKKELLMAGQRAQLSAMQDACDFLYSLPSQLYQCSLALDTGSGTGDEARASLLSQVETCKSVVEKLSRCFSDTDLAVLGQMKDTLNATARGMELAQEEKSDTLLGAHIKHCLLTALYGIRACTALMN